MALGSDRLRIGYFRPENESERKVSATGFAAKKGSFRICPRDMPELAKIG